MSEPNLLAIDQGTTSSRAILFSKDGCVMCVRQKELRLIFPEKGWVEQNPEDIWNDTLSVARDVVKSMPEQARLIASIGITNQRETTILWDRKTGEPIYNAIVWQDRRTADFCDSLKDEGHERKIRKKTGLLLDPYFSATKIAWILRHVKGAMKRAEEGELAFGTVDTFLLWRLTGGKVHATDATNASRTMLFNINTQQWDKELLKLFGIPASILPEVKDTCANFGSAQSDMLGRVIPVGALAGDQQAALIGQACFKSGMSKCTYGTGAFMVMNIGDEFKESKRQLLTTLAYRLQGKSTYAMEGSIFVAGAAIQWLRDGLGLFADSSETQAMAQSVSGSNGVYFVPAFTGLGAPYWDPHAKGMICGLTRDTTKVHIVRAALEAQAYQTLDLMDAFKSDTKFDPAVLRIDGGLVKNEFVCRFLSDMLGIKVEVPVVEETTARGAALMAGLQAGVYNGLDDLDKSWICARSYAPSLDEKIRKTLYKGWKDSVSKILS